MGEMRLDIARVSECIGFHAAAIDRAKILSPSNKAAPGGKAISYLSFAARICHFRTSFGTQICRRFVTRPFFPDHTTFL